MATSGKRDVRLGVEIETTGEESIRQLAADVRKLAQEGTDAAPEFARLASELDKLADQSTALAGLRALTEQVEKLTLEQQQAAEAVLAAGAKYDAARIKAEELRLQQARLAESVREAGIAVVKAKGDIDTYAAGFNKAGKDTAEYTARQAQLARSLADAKTAFAQQKAALDQLTPSVRAATAEETKLGNQVEQLEAKARAGERALQQRNRALDESRAAAVAAGASTTDLAEADQRLLGSIQSVISATQQLGFAQEQTTASTETELAALRDTEQFLQKYEASLREAAAAAEALAAAEGAQAVKRLEEAAKQADAEFRELQQSLRGAEAAAREFAAATERAAAAGKDDVAVVKQRLAAAEALVASERELTVAQRDLANQRDASRAALVAEASALTKVAAAARESQAATVATATAARQAGAAITEAFGALGIRSIDAIEQEIRETEQALTRLEVRARAGALGVDELGRAAGAADAKLARLRAEILQVQAAPTQFERMNTAVNGLITRFGALSAAVATVGFAVRPVLDATIALERTNRILTTVTGSAESAAKQIEFLREVSQKSGQQFTEVADTYAKFAASALQTGLTLEDTQAVFESVALAAGNLGLSSDQTKRALEALSQIAAKGVVSMEELRQQLGDALPGVLPLLAKELGLTTAQLNKVVESGQLLAVEAIPAIGRALKTLGTQNNEQVEGLVASWNRFINVIKEAGTTIVDGPLGQAAGVVITAFGGAVRDVAVVAVSASEAFRLLGLSVVAFLDAITPGGAKLADLGQTISDFAEQSGARIAKFKETAYGASEAVDELGTSLGKTAEEGLKAAGATDTQIKSLAATSVAYTKAIDQAEEVRKASTKLVDAKKDENEALLRTVALAGDEVASRKASVDAAKGFLKVTEDLTASYAAELTAAQAAREATLKSAEALGLSKDTIQTSLDAYDKLIKAKTADVEKSEQQAAAARAAVAQAELAVAALEDNAGQYEALARQVDVAREALTQVARRYAEGKASAVDLQKATEALTRAKGLLVDAMDDQEEASKRAVDALKAESEFTKAQIELELTRLKIKRDEAVARGALTTATQLDNQIRDLELKLSKEGTAAKRAEANEILRVTTLKLDQLRAQGQLTPALEQELQTRVKQQKTALLQIDAEEELQKKTEKLNREMRNGIDTRDQLTGAVDRNSDSTRNNSDELNNNSNELRRNASEADSAREAHDRWIASYVEGYKKRAALTGPGSAKSTLDWEGRNEDGSLKPGGNQSYTTGQSYFTIDGIAVDQVSYQNYLKQKDRVKDPPNENVFGGTAGTVQKDWFNAQNAARGVSTGVTINVTIGGRTQTITAASRAAADAMIAALEEAYRAGGGG
jgi:tape measure domain-containing protein